jgi:hypothetical protein
MNDSSDEGGALVDARPKTSAASKSKPVKVTKPAAKVTEPAKSGGKRAREIVPVVAEGIDEGDDDEEEEDDDDDGESKGEERNGGRETTVTIFFQILPYALIL